MGFLFASGKGGASKEGTHATALLHKLECRACPLDKIVTNSTPHIKPAGAAKPLVYILGPAPSKRDDARGKHFSSEAGQLLKARIPEEFDGKIRWNTVVRTRPQKDRAPEKIEIECCRPSVEKDIVASKPVAIFGMGEAPLRWAVGQSGVAKWRGRRTPVNIGGHLCWYYAFSDLDLLHRIKKKFATRATDVGSELERAFQFDLQRAFDEVESLPEPRVVTREEAAANVELVEGSAAGLQRLEACFKWAMSQKAVGVDYETSAIRPYAKEAKIITAAVGTAKRSFSFPMDHKRSGWTKKQMVRVFELWEEFLRSDVKKVVHRLAFEQEWSAFFFGNDVLRAGKWECTVQQAAIIDERPGDRKPGCFGLEFLVQQYFGFNLKKLSPLDKSNLESEPLKDVLLYNGMDAKFHYMLWREQRKVVKQLGLYAVYRQRVRRIPTLVLTQIKGFPVDLSVNRELKEKYEARIAEVTPKIADLKEVKEFEKRKGETFKPGSDTHVQYLLREILRRREGLHENDDGYSVDESVLKQIDHPISKMLLTYRKSNKRLSTYIIPYGEGSPYLWSDGLMHPIYNTPGTVSDRTSSEDPNAQNMPKRDEEAKEVRRQIVPPKDHLVVAVDYGQIQPRGIAMASQDKALVQSMWERHDIHTEWAEIISRAYPKRVGGKQNFTDKAVMKEFRQVIKAWDLQLFFGATLESSSNRIEVPVEVMKPVYERFWKTFPGVKAWQDKLIKTYREKGIVEHMDGRLNRAPLSINQLINYPIQGIEAEIVMDAMSRLSEREVAPYQANLEIHDDLTFFVPKKQIDKHVEVIVTDMLSVDFDYINVPLTVEVSVGDNLLDVEEVLVASSDTWRK